MGKKGTGIQLPSVYADITPMKIYTTIALVFAGLTAPTLFAAAPHPDREVYVLDVQNEGGTGYSRALRVGRTIYLSGETADGKDMDAQMGKIYERLGKTLAHFGGDFSCVVKETIYTKDIDALVAAIPVRKKFFSDPFPAATWVQVGRLYSPETLLEVDLTAVLPEPTN